MIKSKKVKEIIEKKETVDIICNNCGKTCSNAMRFHNAKKPNCGWSGLNEVEVHGGYDSKFIGDMTSWKFSICEECLSKIVKNFKIPHEIKSEVSSDYVTLKENDKLWKKYEKQNRHSSILAILEEAKKLNKKVNRKELFKLTDRELYDLFHNLAKS